MSEKKTITDNNHMEQSNRVNTKIASGRAEFSFAEVKRVIESKCPDAFSNGVIPLAIPKAKRSPAQKEILEYSAHCKAFSSMVLTNGLAATIVFAYEKKAAWKDVYTNIENWLQDRKFFGNEKTLIEYVCGLETTQYRIVTDEVLALFNWIRRFTAGLIEVDE